MDMVVYISAHPSLPALTKSALTPRDALYGYFKVFLDKAISKFHVHRSQKLIPLEDGILCHNPNLPCDWNNCISQYKNLLQQRTINELVSPDINYYCHRLLLDDVGNCVSGTNESANRSNSERRRMKLTQEV